MAELAMDMAPLGATLMAHSEEEIRIIEAIGIVEYLLKQGDRIGLNEKEDGNLQLWHPSGLSLAESFALLLPEDIHGTVESNWRGTMRQFVSHLLDLVFAGRIKLFMKKKTTGTFTKTEVEKVSVIVANSESVNVPSTNWFLQQLHALQLERLAKGKNPISLEQLIRNYCMNTFSSFSIDLEKKTFGGLVERGILEVGKRGGWGIMKKPIYPTKDSKPEDMLRKDLRAVMKKDIPSTVQFELLLKLVAHLADDIFTKEEEAADEELKTLRKAFEADPTTTLLPPPPDGEEFGPSPFLASDELTKRMVVDQKSDDYKAIHQS